MKKIKGVAALTLVICLLASMLPLPLVTAVTGENGDAVLTGIDIISLPRKTEYFTGEALDTDGMTLLVSYSDDSKVEVSEGFTVSGFNSQVAGEQTLTVTYLGATATFTVTVNQVEVTGIQIVILPVKTEYFTGETLDTTGLTLLASYSDGNTGEIREGFTVTGFNSQVAGEQTLTVTYQGATAVFTVTVNKPELTGIDIISLPRKTEYFTGEALDTAGMTLLVSYSDDSKVEVSEGFTVSGFNSQVTGEQTLTVTYQGATAAFTVTVNALEVTGIDIVSLPRKTEYFTGDTLNTDGMVLVASYTDGSMAEIIEGFTVSGFNSQVAGEQTLTVTYLGATATFAVTVNQLQVIGIEVISLPEKTEYWIGEDLDTTGLILRASYLDGTTAQITEGFTVTGFNSALAGEQTLIVVYGEATAEFTVSVEERSLDGIAIKTLPVKTEYWIGEDLDTTGLTLEAFYSDGSVLEITEGFTISGFSSTTAGQKTVFVKYQEQETFFTVTVKELEVTEIAIKTLPVKTKYWVRDKLDTTGLTLTVTYSDGSNKTVSDGFSTFGFTSITPGTKTVVVRYSGKSTSFTVIVKINCKHTNVENGVCTQCQEPIVATVTDSSGNLAGNFITVADALCAATQGYTLSLQADAAETDVVVLSGVVLDLNGHTLTVNSMLTYSSSAIIDSSEDVRGLLKITEADGNIISIDNCQLPVYDSANSGYRFFSMDVIPCAVTGKNTGTPKYWFKVKAEKFAPLYDLIYEDADLRIKVKLTWDGQEVDAYAAADLAFTKAWADRYSANEDIYITVRVTEAQERDNFKLIPMITSGDFQISGEEM